MDIKSILSGELVWNSDWIASEQIGNSQRIVRK